MAWYSATVVVQRIQTIVGTGHVLYIPVLKRSMVVAHPKLHVDVGHHDEDRPVDATTSSEQDCEQRSRGNSKAKELASKFDSGGVGGVQKVRTASDYHELDVVRIRSTCSPLLRSTSRCSG